MIMISGLAIQKPTPARTVGAPRNPAVAPVTRQPLLRVLQTSSAPAQLSLFPPMGQPRR